MGLLHSCLLPIIICTPQAPLLAILKIPSVNAQCIAKQYLFDLLDTKYVNVVKGKDTDNPGNLTIIMSRKELDPKKTYATMSAVCSFEYSVESLQCVHAGNPAKCGCEKWAWNFPRCGCLYTRLIRITEVTPGICLQSNQQ